MVKALLDTGAPANLFNEELVARGCMQWARDQLHLVAANSSSIPGGNYEVKAQTSLQKFTRKGGSMGEQKLRVSLHVAQLSLDAIPSYPWLAENELLMDPQQNTLSLSTTRNKWSSGLWTTVPWRTHSHVTARGGSSGVLLASMPVLFR